MEAASAFMQPAQIEQVLVQKTGFRSLSLSMQTLGHVLKEKQSE